MTERTRQSELRLARRAYQNAQSRLKQAKENLSFASSRLRGAEAAMKSPAYRAAQAAYYADPDGDIEGYDGA